MTNAAPADHDNAIALIGLAGRFPGAGDVQTFWRNLEAGIESISTVSEDDLRIAGIDDALIEDPAYVRRGGFLDDVECFDAAFFGCSPREASLMEPQHRLFLESCWHALEDAGYTPSSHQGAIGVFGACAMNGYLLHHLATRPDMAPSLFDFQIQIGNDKDYLTTRVSYKLGLKGPSVNVQTACSSSLVAVHMASQSLLNGECHLALAGGVAVSVPQRVGYRCQPGGVYSASGSCRAFDARADGTVFGSGVGVVVLKRLADALADGDHVYAVIKGSAINNDGNDKAGFTAPSANGQAAVVAEALAMAGVDADTVGHVESHGTGTAIGDAIELQALTQAFRQTSQRRGYCALGSVKTNLGHLDVASGVVGLIKTALMLDRRRLLPNCDFRSPHPDLPLADSPFFIPSQPADWVGPLRRAGVSSFGLGGTNCHVVLEQAPALDDVRATRPWQLAVLSANTEAALAEACARLAIDLESATDRPAADLAFTLQTGRVAFAHRRAFVFQDAAGLGPQLRAHQRRTGAPAAPDSEPRVVFMFSGQGSQHVGMGRQIYQQEPVYRQWLDRCAELLQPHLGLDLRALIHAPAERAEAAAQALAQTAITQPALFAVEYALAQQWLHWGVRPWALIGHSIGEYVAACLAGMLSLDDALRIVAARGRLMQGLPPGGMLAVDLPPDALGDLSSAGLGLAAVNAPGRSVLTGPLDAIEHVQSQCAATGRPCSRLRTSHAFHSAMMDPILDEFTAIVASARLQAPAIQMLSNVTGTWLSAEQATDPRYYARHLRQTVRFADGVATLVGQPGAILLEVGPGRALVGSAQQCLARDAGVVVQPSMRHPQQTVDDGAVLLEALGALWSAGVPVDWLALHGQDRPRRVSLPAYPFQRQRHWIDASPRATAAGAAPVPAPRRGANKRPLDDWFYAPVWQPVPVQVPVGAAAPQGPWLLLAQPGGLADQLAQHLGNLSHRVIRVLPGDGPGWLEQDVYALDPTRPDDYRALVQALRSSATWPAHVIHAWCLEPAPDAAPTLAMIDRTQDLGFFSLLYLAQAIEAVGPGSATGITVLTAGAHAVCPPEPLQPERATVTGACIVLSQEFAGLDCRQFDLPLSASEWPAVPAFANALVDEVSAQAPDALVALRGGRRWVRGFEPLALPVTPQPLPGLQPNGVYLITGGFGAIGLALADMLARDCQARLALLGRSGVPDRADWDAWLANHAPADATSQRIRRIQALEAAGAQVLPLQADVADAQQMAQAIAATERAFGRIDGVVHGAGVVDEAAFLPAQDTTRAAAHAHFGPKVAGTVVLQQALAGRRPDFVLLMSSVSAVVGGLGYAPYAAANAFLDLMAQQQAGQGAGRWISVDWDAWVFGQPAGSALAPRMGSVIAELAMTGDEGVAALRRILAHATVPQVVVSTVDLRRRVVDWVGRRPAPKALPAIGAAAVPPGVAPGAGGGDMLAMVGDAWRQVLGVAQIEPEDNFFDVGGDSLLLLDALGRIKASTGIALNPREVLFQTLGQLAALCETRRVGIAALPAAAEPSVLPQTVPITAQITSPITSPMTAAMAVPMTATMSASAGARPHGGGGVLASLKRRLLGQER